jgi:iron complex transport system substrate-binding protein
VLRSSVIVALSVVAVLLVDVSGAVGARHARPPFPVTLVTGTGKVTIPRKPDRIVSLSPTATESLFAIGAGPQVVAVDDQSDFPKTAPRSALSGITPNVEAIAAYRPDLVVAAFDPKGLSGALKKLGIPVLLQGAAATFPGAYRQIRQLGLATGNESAAKRVVRRMKSKIAHIVDGSSGRAAGLSVYHELSPDLYSASSKSFVGKVYRAFGLRNIADAADVGGTGYPQLSAEYVVSESPDLIVLADGICCGQTPAAVAARPGWSQIRAVRSGSIVRIDDSIASRWGPRIVNFFRAVSSALRRLHR